MKKYEQVVASLIVGGFVIILLADTLRQLMGYLILLAAFLVILRVLFRDR